MSYPNPRRHYRRFSDERIWWEFMVGCLARHPPRRAAEQADEAYAEYCNRFPKAAAALEPDTEPDESTIQNKEGTA